MKTKEYSVELKEAGEDTPSIVAYASTFDRDPDCYGDVVAKGAFTKTLEEWGESGLSIPLLFGHRTDDPMMNLGKVVSAEEDDNGLLITAEFDMENPNAVKARRDVLAGTLGKMSFAFEVLDEGMVVLEDGTKANELREMKLFEVSLVPIPANQHAVVVDAKSMETAESEPDEKQCRRNSAADEAELERISELADEIKETVSGLTASDNEADEEAEEQNEAKDAQSEEPSEAKADEEAEEKENKTFDSKENQMENIINEIGTGEIEVDEAMPKSLGDFAAKSLKGIERGSRFSMTTPEFKAATDTHVIGTPVPAAMTDFDRNVYYAKPMLSVRDLLASETISGSALTYYVEDGIEGGFDVVAEGGEKPQAHFKSKPVTVPLNKIAAFLKESDEIIDDAKWMADAINNRGIYALKVKEEGLIVTWLLATNGVQAIAEAPSMDNIAQAIANVQANGGMAADAIVMNPATFQALAIAKDGNGQYILGGPAQAAMKTVWGVPVITSAACPVGKAIVGAFKQGASLVSKGGVRVEATNSDSDDFTHNLVTIRIEERAALAVRYPKSFCVISA